MPDDTNRAVALATSDAMTAITRVGMLVTTVLVSLITWQAQQLIGQVKDQQAQLSVVALRQMTSDGALDNLKNMSTEQGRRIERLENKVWKMGYPQ